MRRFILLPTVLFSTVVFANKLDLGVSYEQYHMPNSLPPLGVAALHANYEVTPWFYSGLVGYEAVSGNKGGYFGLGLDEGVQHPIWGDLWANTGVRTGGAGGRSSPVGGGLFYQPYAGLQYHFSQATLGIEYNDIEFPSGHISSHQWNVGISTPMELNLRDSEFYDENSIAFKTAANYPTANTRDTNGQIDTAQFGTMGIELDHYFQQSVFAFGDFLGAFRGRANGFAQSTLGLGYTLPIGGRMDLLAKLGAGAAGGGALDTGGGFIVTPTVGMQMHLTRLFAWEIDANYTHATSGHFDTESYSALVKYYFNRKERMEDNHDWRVRLNNQTYFSPQNSAHQINPAMQLLNVDFDYWIQSHWYATGQTAFAYSGKNTGGYFSGMLGAGGQTSTWKNHFYSFGELLVGTGGGAGLDIGTGALYEPVLGLGYAFTQTTSAQISVGRLMAFTGKFNSTVMNVGLGVEI